MYIKAEKTAKPRGIRGAGHAKHSRSNRAGQRDSEAGYTAAAAIGKVAQHSPPAGRLKKLEPDPRKGKQTSCKEIECPEQSVEPDFAGPLNLLLYRYTEKSIHVFERCPAALSSNGGARAAHHLI